MLNLKDDKTGKILENVYPVEVFKYGSRNQKIFAGRLSAKYILVTGDHRGHLPLWVHRVLKQNGLWFKKIGRTTYKTNTFALYYPQ